MTTLFCLLFAALYPTGQLAFDCDPSAGTKSLPAVCFWQPSDGKHMGPLWQPSDEHPNWEEMTDIGCLTEYGGFEPDAVIAYIFFTLSFAWKASLLMRKSRVFLLDTVCQGSLRFLESSLKKLAADHSGALSRLMLIFAMSVYIPVLATAQIAQSFAATLFTVLSSLVWGTVQLARVRGSLVNRTIAEQENQWGFGQILPMLLLAVPFITIFSDAYGWCHSERDKTSHFFNNDSRDRRGEDAGQVGGRRQRYRRRFLV